MKSNKILRTIRNIILWLLDIFFLIYIIMSFYYGGLASGILLSIALVISNPIFLDKLPKIKGVITIPTSIILFIVSMVTLF